MRGAAVVAACNRACRRSVVKTNLSGKDCSLANSRTDRARADFVMVDGIRLRVEGPCPDRGMEPPISVKVFSRQAACSVVLPQRCPVRKRSSSGPRKSRWLPPCGMPLSRSTVSLLIRGTCTFGANRGCRRASGAGKRWMGRGTPPTTFRRAGCRQGLGEVGYRLHCSDRDQILRIFKVSPSLRFRMCC